MEMSKVHLILLLLVLGICGCMKDEIPAPPHVAGDIETTQISLRADYRYQIYFDLSSNQMISQNLKTDWDLGFECIDEGWHIKLNGAKAMKVTLTNETNFANIDDTTGDYIWKWDMESGNLDSTAIGDWRDHNNIYIIQRGYNEKGKYLGAIKIRFISLFENKYIIEFSDIKDASTTIDTVSKLKDINYMSYSFDDGGKEIVLEPNKKDWDLLFSQYTTYFKEEDVTYLVTGVLQNPTGTSGTEDKIHEFKEITLESMTDLEFSDRIDNPGYDWKTYNFDQGEYLVDVDRNYIFLTNEGFYKLRFIDYVDNQGERGAPLFEYQKL